MPTIASTHLLPIPPPRPLTSPARIQTPPAKRLLGHGPHRHQPIQSRKHYPDPRSLRSDLSSPRLPHTVRPGTRPKPLRSGDLRRPPSCAHLVHRQQLLPQREGGPAGRAIPAAAGCDSRSGARSRSPRRAPGAEVVADRQVLPPALRLALRSVSTSSLCCVDERRS